MRRLDCVLPLAFALSLSACERGAAASEESAPPRSALEAAARDAGLIRDGVGEPVGAYGRDHEGGHDMFCIVPDKRVGRYRFATDVNFGRGESCRGSGTARRTADKLVLIFSDRPHCLIVADIQGDRLALPGVLDRTCAALCQDRASLEGVSFPLTNSGAQAARNARTAANERPCA